MNHGLFGSVLYSVCFTAPAGGEARIPALRQDSPAEQAGFEPLVAEKRLASASPTRRFGETGRACLSVPSGDRLFELDFGGEAVAITPQCFVCTIFKVAKPHAVSEVEFVFDNRPHREAANRRVFEFFERHRQVVQEGPVIAPISFQSSVESPPLQASDLVAWEYYQFGLQWLREGAAALRRPHLQRLAEARLLEVQFAGPEQIRPLVAFNQEQPLLREFGAAFEKGLASLPPWMR
jgi:hypothetical protein